MTNQSNDFQTEVYAAWRTDIEVRQESSSGGVASAISERWIENGGVVYGSAYQGNFVIGHIRCTKKSELNNLRGSKYVVSSINGITEKIKQDLRLNLPVLFIGIPCQVAGFKKQFGSAITTIDLVCHGAPKQDFLWESLPEDIRKLDFDNVIFRDKTKYHLSLKKDGQTIWDRPLKNDLFLKGFFKGIYNRDCCFSCKFANVNRVGDITLGDFWGIDKKTIDTKAEDGISLIIINTEKGKEIFSSASDLLTTKSSCLAEAIRKNKPLNHPCRKTVRVILFRKLYPHFGFRVSATISLSDILLKNMIFS